MNIPSYKEPEDLKFELGGAVLTKSLEYLKPGIDCRINGFSKDQSQTKCEGDHD